MVNVSKKESPARVAGKRVPPAPGKKKAKTVKGDAIQVAEPDGLALALAEVLTPKMCLFIDYYVMTLNATQAAKAAGYSGDDVSLAATGYRLLRNIQIKSEIDRRLAQYTMSANEILTRITDIARGDIGDVLNSMGGVDVSEAVARGKSHLIKRIKTKTTTIVDERSNRETEIHETEVELYDALDALKVLAKFHGLLVDRVQVATWEDKAINDIRAGLIEFIPLAEAFGKEKATQLFLAAGVGVE